MDRARLVALVLAGAVSLLAVPASATPPPFEQVIPESTPAPTTGLLLHMPGVPDAWSISQLTRGAVKEGLITQAPPEAEGGRFLRFSAGSQPGGELKYPLTPGSGLFIQPNPPKSANPVMNGATFALWYRRPAAIPKVTGVNPLFLVGTNSQGWGYGVVLRDGVPVVARKGDTWLFGDGSIKTRVSPTQLENGAIDDGAWHHVALRLARPGCTAASCPTKNTMLVSLFVDGVVRGEEIAFLVMHQSWVQLGVMDSATDFAAQSNYDAVGRRIQTMGDIDDLYLYEAALAATEIQSLRHTRGRGMRFQLPHLDPAKIGWNGPPPQIGAQLPTALPSRPQGGTGPLDLLALNKQSPTAGVAPIAAPQGLGEHTFAAWTQMPPFGLVYGWMPAQDAGWDVIAEQGMIGLLCRANGTQQFYEIPVATAGSWHLISVTASATSLSLGYDHQLLDPLPCNAASVAAADAQLLMYQPEATGLAWLALYAGASSAPALMAIASPGPSIRSSHAWTGVHPNPIQQSHQVDIGLPWVVGRSPNNAKNRYWTEVDGLLLSGAGSPTRDASVSVGFTVIGVDPAMPTIPIVSRNKGGWSGYDDFAISATCISGRCSLLVRVPDVGRVRHYRLQETFPLGQEVVIGVAWPATRLLAPESGKTGATLTVVEPLVSLDGRLKNRRFSTEPNLVLEDASLPSTISNNRPTWWTIGDNRNASAPDNSNGTSYSIRNVRLYGRAVQDIWNVSRECSGSGGLYGDCSAAYQVCGDDATTGGAVCGGCAGGSFLVGGVGPHEKECHAQYLVGEACSNSVECYLSGPCVDAFCAPRNIGECTSHCTSIGRACDQPSPGTFECGACLPGYEAMPDEPAVPATPDAVCAWSPKKTYPEPCSADAECTSNRCRFVLLDSMPQADYAERTVSRNGCTGVREADVDYRNDKRTSASICMAASADECTAFPHFLPAVASAPIVRPDDSEAPWYDCTPASSGTCSSRALVSVRPVLTTAACEKAAIRTNDTTTGNCTRVRTPLRDVFLNGSGLTADKLKQLFLPGDGTPYRISDDALLVDEGVGPLLVAYAKATPLEKQAMVAQYGELEPLEGCFVNRAAAMAPTHGDFAYHGEANRASCVPKRQPDGATCPVPGYTQPPGREWCRSGYCSRDAHVCERGDDPLQEIRGKGGNKKNQGKSGVKFGIVRVDDTRLVMEESKSRPSKQHYLADLNQSHVACLMGEPFPPMPIFETRIHLDQDEGSNCSATEVSSFVLGFPLSGPRPSAATASCTGYSGGTSGQSPFQSCRETNKPSCDPIQVSNLSATTLASYAIPALKFCAPFGQEGGIQLPELKKDFKEFLVPLYISFGLTLDLCVSFAIGLDGQGLPQAELTPNVGVGVEAKGGIGIAETGAYEFGAGVRLALTLVDIAFPITWAVVLEIVSFTDTVTTPGRSFTDRLLKLEIIQKIGMVITMLSGEFGLFAELSIGPFSLEWTFNIFDWVGFKFEFDLSEIPLFSTKLDFKANSGASGGPAAATCNANHCY